MNKKIFLTFLAITIGITLMGMSVRAVHIIVDPLRRNLEESAIWRPNANEPVQLFFPKTWTDDDEALWNHLRKFSMTWPMIPSTINPELSANGIYLFGVSCIDEDSTRRMVVLGIYQAPKDGNQARLIKGLTFIERGLPGDIVPNQELLAGDPRISAEHHHAAWKKALAEHRLPPPR